MLVDYIYTKFGASQLIYAEVDSFLWSYLTLFEVTFFDFNLKYLGNGVANQYMVDTKYCTIYLVILLVKFKIVGLMVREIHHQDQCTPKKAFSPPTTLIFCLLYTSPSPRDRQKSRMPSSA